jgi:hypothetical protein
MSRPVPPVITSFLRKPTVEVTLHFLPVGGVSRLRQYDRINDFVAFKLCGDKRPGFRQFLVSKFHSSAVDKFLDPLVVLHDYPQSTFGGIFDCSLSSGRSSLRRLPGKRFVDLADEFDLSFRILFQSGFGAKLLPTFVCSCMHPRAEKRKTDRIRCQYMLYAGTHPNVDGVRLNYSYRVARPLMSHSSFSGSISSARASTSVSTAYVRD